MAGFTGIEDGFARVCNDAGECSEIPLCFVVGAAPNCLPELIEIDVTEGGTTVEVCLDDYCSELANMGITVLNPPVFAFKVVLKNTFETNPSNKTFEWELAHLENGMYFFGIEGKQGAFRILLQN